MTARSIAEQLHADARTADALHERSRELLVSAVRSGSAAGLSQRQIATAIGRSQPEVSRLLKFHGSSRLGATLMQNRKRVLDIATDHGAKNVRVFGSVAQGTDGPDSDVDLLVDVPSDTGLFALARLEQELTELLGAPVDVVPAASLRENLSGRVLSEAVPL